MDALDTPYFLPMEGKYPFSSMRTAKMKDLIFDRHGFEVDQEITAQMLVDGRVTYVPIGYRPRLGRAKAPTWRQGFRALFAILGIARRYNRLVLFGVVTALVLSRPQACSDRLHSPFFLNGYHSIYFLVSLTLFVIEDKA